MPVRKVKGGYRFGKSGKIHKTKKAADRQARAIYASGYGKKKKNEIQKKEQEKSQKVVVEDYILTKIQKILLELSLLLQKMREQLYEKLKEFVKVMQEKYRY